ncbi:MAG: hypothetical protein DPW18_06800 [Chloroflexi bacterium]|nr:hypothetical protein [Chloroflexota bacterium]MDL1941583.1 type II toxin-antitoxin system VapC family toxin [Chloroflexi bacterium CFX2]
MTVYMADTHSLLWAFHAPRKLGKNARRAFEEIANGEAKLLIPVIVLAELIFTIENKPVEADLNKILEAISREGGRGSMKNTLHEWLTNNRIAAATIRGRIRGGLKGRRAIIPECT